MKINLVKIFSVFIMAIYCVSCTSKLNISVKELKFLDQNKTFSGNGSTITVSGMLQAVIESDIDLIKYAVENNYNLSYTVQGCSSKIEFSRWSGLYRKESQSNLLNFTYDVVFDYKRRKNEIIEITYNLIKHQENICIFVTAGNMNPFLYAQSNIVNIPISEPVLIKLMDFDKSSREPYFQGADYCEKRMCIPDYKM
jgi:hypothetical protein